VGERHASERTGVVDQKARPEVVAAVDHHVVLVDQVLDVLGRDASLVFPNVDVGIEVGDELRRRVDLRPADVVGPVDDLALEVRALDDVVVGDTERPHARGREVLDDRRPQSARPDGQHVGVQQRLLARRPHIVHDDVPGVAVELVGVQVGSSHTPVYVRGTQSVVGADRLPVFRTELSGARTETAATTDGAPFSAPR
jgi:hypothetical protein